MPVNDAVPGNEHELSLAETASSLHLQDAGIFDAAVDRAASTRAARHSLEERLRLDCLCLLLMPPLGDRPGLGDACPDAAFADNCAADGN